MTLDEQVAVLTAIQKRAKELLDELRPDAKVMQRKGRLFVEVRR